METALLRIETYGEQSVFIVHPMVDGFMMHWEV